MACSPLKNRGLEEPDDGATPYLREFARLQAELADARARVDSPHSARPLSAHERRVWCVRRYAFAIPTEQALATIARYAPIVELGAGTGYWAFLLRRRGVNCVAYDLAPPDAAASPNRFRPFTWTRVDRGDVDALAA